MNSLTTLETSELEQCESVIERGLKTFVEVGNALLKIRDGKLYRIEHGTFEDYCKERWNMQRNYANKLIAASEVVQNLGTIVPILPTSESVVRPLTKLEPEVQPIVWQQAVETAPNGKITAAHVQSVVDDYKPQAQKITLVEDDAYDDTDDYNWTVDDDEKTTDFDSEMIAPEQPKIKLAAANHSISDTPGYDGDEWYTPREYIECARKVLGVINLDPATCQEAQAIVCAEDFYTKDDDSLRDDIKWFGNVWLNPPYSAQLIKRFIDKVINEYRCGNITQAIVLVNNSSDTAWFHSLLDYPVCLTKGRVNFWRPNHKEFGTRQGQAIFYLGKNIERFAKEFSSVGKTLVAYDNQQ